MSIFRLLLIFPLLLLSPVDRKPERSDLLRLEQRWVKALETRDREALDRILDDEFLDVTYTGELRDKRAALQALSAADRPSSTNDLRDLRVRFSGETAIVTGTNVAEGKDRKSHCYSVHGRFRQEKRDLEGAFGAGNARQRMNEVASSERRGT